jgi:hypothetical protein
MISQVFIEKFNTITELSITNHGCRSHYCFFHKYFRDYIDSTFCVKSFVKEEEKDEDMFYFKVERGQSLSGDWQVWRSG